MLSIIMLVNGDYMVGKMTIGNDEDYHVKQPLILKAIPTPNGVGSLPTVFPSKDEFICVKKQSICIGPAEPIKELEELHIQMFSGLVIPTTKVSVK